MKLSSTKVLGLQILSKIQAVHAHDRKLLFEDWALHAANELGAKDIVAAVPTASMGKKIMT